MKTNRSIQKRRNHGRFLRDRERVSLPLMLMVFGYLFGCVFGILVAINADVNWIDTLSPNLVDKPAPGLFTVFCGCASYGLGMLFLATSYLGFLFVPIVFSLKGFLSASVFTACMCSDLPHGLERACAGLILPGVFLLPAMLILGQRCIHWSVRLFRCRSGEWIAPDPTAPRALGTALVFLLAAAAVKAYVVPYVLGLL